MKWRRHHPVPGSPSNIPPSMAPWRTDEGRVPGGSPRASAMNRVAKSRHEPPPKARVRDGDCTTRPFAHAIGQTCRDSLAESLQQDIRLPSRRSARALIAYCARSAPSNSPATPSYKQLH
jgi:hypothetical protein